MHPDFPDSVFYCPAGRPRPAGQLLLRILILFLLPFTGRSQTRDTDTLDVVNWNIRYFADPAQNNPAVQVAGVRQIMNGLNADIYALCEVVNVDSFQHLAQSLNGGYSAVVSTFGSLADNPGSANYASAQKLGLIYRTAMVRNVSTRAMLRSSQSAYYSFSSGRFPYEVRAEVLGRDSTWRPVTFIVLHAKAYTDASSCTRRIDGCLELKDTLDHYFANTSFLLLGDFNDDLDVSNCGGGPSNYAAMVADSARYACLTLPISKAGAYSIDGYNSLIDHAIASNELYRYYVPGSAQSLRSYVKSLVTNYDNQVSDHFPIRTRFVLDAGMHTSVPETVPGIPVKVYPVPAATALILEASGPQPIAYGLYGQNGQLLLQGVLTGNKCVLNTSELAPGAYLLRLYDGEGRQWHRLIPVVR